MLFGAIIRPELCTYCSRSNKYRDELILQYPGRRTEIECRWITLTHSNNAVMQENEAPRGEPRPIVELIWEKPPVAFALTKELEKGAKSAPN